MAKVGQTIRTESHTVEQTREKKKEKNLVTYVTYSPTGPHRGNYYQFWHGTWVRVLADLTNCAKIGIGFFRVSYLWKVSRPHNCTSTTGLYMIMRRTNVEL